MSKEGKALDVAIMGREFRIACPEGEEQSLKASVDYLDKKMRDIRDAGKVIGIERIAIMAALNIAHELLTTRVGGGFDLGEIKRRMNALEEQIDQAISDQNKLF